MGDRIALTGTIFPGEWEFTVRGIYRGRDRTTDTSIMFMRWDYLNEWMKANSSRQDRAGWYMIKIDKPKQAAEITKPLNPIQT